MWSMLVWCVRAAIFFVPLYYFLKWNRKHSAYASKINLLPGPPTWPIFGNALALGMNLDPVVLFERMWSDSFVYGSIYRVWIFFSAQVVIQGARQIERILKDMTHHTKSLQYQFLHPWMGEGLLTSNNDKWRVHRKILTPAFHFNILHEFLSTFNKHALKLTHRLAEEPEAKSKSGFNIFRHTSLCSLDIICESSMGLEIKAQENEKSPYVIAVNRMNDLLVHRYFTPIIRPEFLFNLSPTKREMYKILDYLNNFTDEVIAKRRQYLASLKQENGNQNPDDDVGKRRSLAFLDLLLAAEEDGAEYMTQKDIRDQVSTFLFEGHDTVSTATSWMLFIMGTYPDIQRRVVEELEEVFGDSGRAPEMADLANLKYLERCIKETLRLYPSVPFFERSLKTDDIIEKNAVPGGTTISVNMFIIHRDPEFWPDPDKFDPDRFLPENTQNRHPYAYIPFSAGPRNCIGQKFALLEEKVVVSTVLRRFRVEAAQTLEDTKLQVAVVLRPKNGLHVRLFEREDKPKLRVADPVSN